MIDFSDFRFLDPLWLLLLPLAWWLVWTFAGQYHRRSMWYRICDRRLLQRMLGQSTFADGNRLLAWLLGAILTLGLLAAAGPSWRAQSQPSAQFAAARVIVINLARSMLVEDVKPNRLAQAMEGAREIIAAPFDGETGLVVFAGAAFVVSPLSTDANSLLAYLDALNPDTMPLDGARVDLAIFAAQQLLEASVAASGQLLVITDSAEDLEAATQAAFHAGAEGHSVSVIAVGTIEGGPLLDPAGGLQRNARGEFLLARTPVSELSRIAEVGQGVLIRMTPVGGLDGQIEAALEARESSLSRQFGQDAAQTAANEGYWLVWLILPLALLLFRRNLIWVLLLTVMLPLPRETHARDWASLWRHDEQAALKAYREERYEAVLELSSNPLLQGSAYYRLRRYEQALDTFTREESATSLFNRGNALAQLHRFTEAAVAYRAAVELDTGHARAAANLQLIEDYLQQQQAQAANADSEAGEEEVLDSIEQQAGNTRIGIAGQNLNNPADEADSSSGLGASAQMGEFDPSESFDGNEEQLEQYLRSLEQGDRSRNAQLVEYWLKTLPETSSDLYQRKFLRDYRRQQKQDR